MSLGWRRKGGKGRPVVYRTWMGLWMSSKNIGIDEFARILLVATSTVENWRKGGNMSSHSAKLIKAFFPDAPIHYFAGPVVPLSQPIPICARTQEFYKFIFHLIGLLDGRAHPDALAKARQLKEQLGLRALPKTSSDQPDIPPQHR